MKLPFHGVHVCGDILFAARGGNIHSFSTDGTHIACWKYPVEAKAQKNGQHAVTPNINDDDDHDNDDGPPAKRAKLDNTGKADAIPAKLVNDDEVQGKKKGRKGQQHGRSNLAHPSERPMVIIMASSKDESASHLIAVTSDKSIWVFEHDGRGGLTQLSRRTMPKRPCSIVLTPDNKDILSADKFGDVYSLPLLPSADPATTQQPTTEPSKAPSPTSTTTPAAAVPPTEPAQASFTPQATNLTVHTARNRRALSDQLASRANPKAWVGGTPKRATDAFERHLLLGHVSLLTAIALGHDAAGRPYILTADRDEHIRVSRGTRAQAHVVERYCMGHTQFVNRLLVAGGGGGLLVSGGGDGDVFVWRWLEGALCARADVLGRVREVVGADVDRIAVTGLSAWAGGEGEGLRIVVHCERVPAIFLFNLQDSGALEFSNTIHLPGNPFEVGVVDGKKLLVAVDPSQKDAGAYDVKKSLLTIEHTDGGYKVLEDVIKDAGSLEAEILSSEDIPSDELDKMLYSAETLRKIHPEDKVDAEDIKGEQDIMEE